MAEVLAWSGLMLEETKYFLFERETARTFYRRPKYGINYILSSDIPLLDIDQHINLWVSVWWRG